MQQLPVFGIYGITRVSVQTVSINSGSMVDEEVRIQCTVGMTLPSRLITMCWTSITFWSFEPSWSSIRSGSKTTPRTVLRDQCAVTDLYMAKACKRRELLEIDYGANLQKKVITGPFASYVTGASHSSAAVLATPSGGTGLPEVTKVRAAKAAPSSPHSACGGKKQCSTHPKAAPSTSGAAFGCRPSNLTKRLGAVKNT